MSETGVVKGFKVFNPDWTCNPNGKPFQYAVGGTYEEDVIPMVCDRGFHFCEKAADCFNYYQFNPENKVAEVLALGEVDTDGTKSCTNKIQIVREIPWAELLEIVNTGKGCTGLCNSGNRNSGNRNSGDWNSGNRNSGDWNSGDWNSGNRNSGNRNSGNRNSGDWNKCSFSNGCFNTVSPKIYLFNKPSEWTYQDWLNSEAHYLLNQIPGDVLEYIYFSDMTDADVQLEDLEAQFKGVSGGWTFDEVLKDFGSLEDFTDGDDLAKLKDLHSQVEAIEAQKAEWQQKLNEKLIAEQKKALAKQQVELEAQKAAVQQQLDDFEVKTYSGIWYNKDVTTADWAGLNIEGKKKYYEGKFITETDPDLMQKYQDLYKQLEELDTEGKAYADIQKELKQIQSQITKVQGDLKKLEQGGIIDSVDDAFSQERKDAAIWAKTTKEADDVLRDTCGEVWRTSPPIQKNAIYDYTQSYHKFNEPLRGIEYGSEKFLGVGNVDLDQIGVSYQGWKPGQMRKEINAMTDIISKSTYKEDFWLQRGCRFKGMDKFFNVPMDRLQSATQAELEALLLQKEVTEYGFCSCGVAKGKGFSGDIILNIYAPSGTQMMYVEPFSAFGNGGGKNWDGIAKQGSFGQESEIILQQGTKFRVTKVEKTPGMIYIDLEVIEQTPQR